MNFKFLPYQSPQLLKDLIHEMQYKGTQDVADMYQPENPPKHILGYQIKDVFLYYICQQLIASLITFNCNSKYHPEIIEKLSEQIGASPSINGNYYCWMDETIVLYCYQDDEDMSIRLYYTISEYNILG